MSYALGRIALLNDYDIVREDHSAPICTTGDPDDPEFTAEERLVAKSNARRIVATWNACVGVTTEALESPYSAIAALVRVTEQRDELLALLRKRIPRDIDTETADHIHGLAEVQAAVEKCERGIA